MNKHHSLQRFHALVEEEPLFAAEGLNTQSARASLRRLEGALANLEDIMSRGRLFFRLFFTRYPLRNYAVPVSFLSAFCAAEDARRRFLLDPSEPHAGALLYSWRSACRALRADIRRYGFLHRMAYRLEAHSKRTFHDAYGNPYQASDVDEILRLLDKNGRMLEEEVLRYQSVFEGEPAPKRDELPVPPAPALRKGTMLPWQERLHAAVLEDTVPFRGARIIESHGPFFHTLSLLDGKPAEHLFFAYILEGRGTKARFLHLMLADDYYFLPLQDKKTAAYPTGYAVLEPYLKAGLSHSFHPSIQLYLSRDVSHWPELASAVDRERRPHLNAKNVSSQRSSLLDLLIGNGVEDILYYCEQTAVRMHKTGRPMPHPYLNALFARTHPGLFYLPFNRSVWRIEEAPPFLGKGKNASEARFYRSARELDIETCEDIIKRGGRLLREGWLRDGTPGIRQDHEF